MKVLVFGNPLAKRDSAALRVAKALEGKVPEVQFVHFDTSEDLEKEGEELVILDSVLGLASPRIIELSELELPQRPLSLHGFDLLWSLLLLKKLGKLKKATIIGVPAKRPARQSAEKVKRILTSLQSFSSP
ncbi:MAG: hypothetical protein N3G22_03755 [Candidatus Micrarchaeota archaeon]|nr:hypothetical protein [Candidatus Micrarchaeota archaeon]